MTRRPVRSLGMRLASLATAALFSLQMGLEAPLIALGQVRVSPPPPINRNKSHSMKPVHTAFVSHYPYDVSAHSSSSGHPYHPPHTLSLLDEMGWPAGSVSAGQVQHWQRVYTQGRFPTWRKAWAALRLVEDVLEGNPSW